MVEFPRFIAYYSYKGGVGRSLALANTAFVMASQGHKVLIIDMDFEAPGQHMTELFVRRGVDRAGLSNWPGSGFLEMLKDWVNHVTEKSDEPYSLQVLPYLRRPREEVNSTLIEVAKKRQEDGEPGEIWLMPSGRANDANYAEQVGSFSWARFSDLGGGSFLDGLRHTLGQEGFDYVLIDTRTGYSEEFLVAGFDLADTVVVLSSYNRQNIEGTRDVMQRLEAFNHAQVNENVPHLCKQVLLVGSPQPALGTDNLNRRLSDIRLQWPELQDFDLHLPYVPEFALEERIDTWENPQGSRMVSSYSQQINLLCTQLQQQTAQLSTPLRPTAPQNPFALLRGGHIDSPDVVRYFVDPGGNIVADMLNFTPLVITGARGTGKTMLARRFCIDEWFADLAQRGEVHNLADVKQIGLYFHIDSDVLHSFNQKNDDSRKSHDRLFTFFFDIVVIRKAISALTGLGILGLVNSPRLLSSLYSELGESTPNIVDFTDFLNLLENRLTDIRLFLNNPHRFELPVIAAPNILFKRLIENLRTNPAFEGKYFAVHIDEFENFETYQQRVLNTRLKHARQDECVTYRFYMRSGGFSTRETLAPGQSIENTHDFRQHSLDEDLDFDTFKAHAVRVANRHLELSPWFKTNGYLEIGDLLQDLSAEEEASDLASGKREKVLEKWVEKHHEKVFSEVQTWFETEPSYLRRAVAVVILNQGKPAHEVIASMRANDQQARYWYHNYHRGTLHWLCRLHHRDKRYAGLNTLTGLSGNNIRVFIDFCYSSFSGWLAGWDKQPQSVPIQISQQDNAVRLQAKILRQNLYSASRSGVEINRFLERFGRLCEAVHKSPKQSEPEVNHFSIKGEDAPEELKKLLRNARFEGVVRQLPGNKQKSLEDERQDDWQLAPWLCPLFNLSSRRKKKMSLTAEELGVLFIGTDDEWKVLWRTREKALGVVADDAQGGLFT